jgi:hypothetical protein
MPCSADSLRVRSRIDGRASRQAAPDTAGLGGARQSVMRPPRRVAFEIIEKFTTRAGYVIVRAGHPLTGKTSVEIADVLDYAFAQVATLPPRVLKPILAARRPPSVHEVVSASLCPAIECPTINGAATIVASLNAFTLTTLGIVQAELERSEIVPLPVASWIRAKSNIVRSRKRTMSSATIAFVEDAQRAHFHVLREDAVLRERWFALRERASPAKHAIWPTQTKPRDAMRSWQARGGGNRNAPCRCPRMTASPNTSGSSGSGV